VTQALEALFSDNVPAQYCEIQFVVKDTQGVEIHASRPMMGVPVSGYHMLAALSHVCHQASALQWLLGTVNEMKRKS
jgi:hypothetical protein